PNGVRSGVSPDRNAIRSSIFHAPSSRASSSTSPARVTAGLGSQRNSPGARTGTAGPGAGTSGWPPGRIVARRAAVGRAGDPAAPLLEAGAAGDDPRLPAGRHHPARQAGRALEADGPGRAGGGRAPRQRGLAAPGPHGAPAAAPRGVDEHRVYAGEADVA